MKWNNQWTKTDAAVGGDGNTKLGKTSVEKKRFLSGIARMRGGVYPCPDFLAPFLDTQVSLAPTNVSK